MAKKKDIAKVEKKGSTKNSGKAGELGPKQKKFCELYFTNNFDRKAAYIEAYGYNPDYKWIAQNAYHLMKEPAVIKHLAQLSKNLEIKYGVNKAYLVRSVLGVIDDYEEMKMLADLDNPTELEQAKFKRLSTLTKTADLNRAQDLLAKLIGFYEPEVVEHKVTYEVSFGAPKENIIDIDHDDIIE